MKNATPKTYSELVNLIAQVLPEASFGEDGEGQLVIYTNLSEDREGNLSEFVPDDSAE
jgi:hypothetical protein